jgi:3'(2'), 5'-bisphosphate nucleotidase
MSTAGTEMEAGQLARELQVASRLARQAGAVALDFHGGELKVELKPGNEPVTVADKQASDLIVSGLRQAFPDDVVISEENRDDRRRLEAKRVWYVDPIDGTKDFIRGEDGFCVMIGLALDHRPALGVVFQPTSQRLYVAAPGSGAWVLPPDSEPVRLQASAIDNLAEVRLVASKSHRDATIDRIKTTLGISDELNIGSVGLKLAIIAAGERDLYVNPTSHCSSWDTCAPEAILAEAGGRLSDIHGEPLRYDTELVGHGRGLLASNGLLHDAAVAKLAPLFPR